MAQSGKITVTNVWTQLTGGDATTITFVPMDGDIIVRATTGSAPAETEHSGIPYIRGQRELKRTITELSHTASVDRVFAKASGFNQVIVFSEDDSA